MCARVCRFSRSVASNYMRERDQKKNYEDVKRMTTARRTIVFLLSLSLLSVSFHYCYSLSLCNQRLDQQAERQKRKEELRYVFFWKTHTIDFIQVQRIRFLLLLDLGLKIDQWKLDKNVARFVVRHLLLLRLSIRMLSSVIIELPTGNMIRRRTERKIHTVRDNISNSCCRV